MQAIQIEDSSDCVTCTRRDADLWDLLLEATVKSLGTAWCTECGRNYTVLCEAEEKDRE